MSKFGALKNLDVNEDKTAEYKMVEITVNGKSPIIITKMATQANKSYFNQLLKMSSTSAHTANMVKAGKINSAMVDEAREKDKALFPKYVMVDWKDVVDLETGKEVPFSEEDAAEFIEALPDWVFENFRQFAGNTVNFTDVLDISSGVEKGKNSQSG